MTPAIRTCSGVGFRLGLFGPVHDVLHVDRDARFGEVPHKVLDLVLAVLVLQQLDELLQPFLGVVDQRSARVAELFVVGIEDIGGEQRAKVDDGLFI